MAKAPITPIWRTIKNCGYIKLNTIWQKWTKMEAATGEGLLY
jgi:hypothetical protein